MNITIAIADANRDYLERLSEVLREYEDLTVSVFTTGEKLQEALENKRFDIVLFDPDISSQKLAFSNAKLSVCLYSDEAQNKEMYADCEKVVKYQRISSIYKDIINAFADKAGYGGDFDNSQNTRIIAVYSPIGGSGKTTVALAIASKMATMGKRVLFLNTEQLNSTVCVNPTEGEGITGLIEATAENVNFELKLKGNTKQGIQGIDYVEGFERIVDYNSVSAEEISAVLNKIKRCGICDAVVVDMGSLIDGMASAILGIADSIVIVEKPGELPSAKMDLFMQQALVVEHRGKMLKVANFADSNAKFSQELDVPSIGTVHNYGNYPLKNMLQNICAQGEIRVDKLVG